MLENETEHMIFVLLNINIPVILPKCVLNVARRCIQDLHVFSRCPLYRQSQLNMPCTRPDKVMVIGLCWAHKSRVFNPNVTCENCSRCRENLKLKSPFTA